MEPSFFCSLRYRQEQAAKSFIKYSFSSKSADYPPHKAPHTPLMASYCHKLHSFHAASYSGNSNSSNVSAYIILDFNSSRNSFNAGRLIFFSRRRNFYSRFSICRRTYPCFLIIIFSAIHDCASSPNNEYL